MKLTYSHLILGLLFLSVSLAGNAASEADLPCTNPTVFTWIDHECSNNTFRVIVDLQFGGSAAFYDIFYSSQGGPEIFLTSALPGTLNPTAYFPFGTLVNIYVKDPTDVTCTTTFSNLTQLMGACCTTPSFNWSSTPDCSTGLYQASFTLGSGTGMSYSVYRSVAGGPNTFLGTYGSGTHSVGYYYLGQSAAFEFISNTSNYCSFYPALSNTTVCNETCAQAQLISCGSVTSGHTNGALPENPDPGTCGTPAGTGGAVWYKFTGSNSENPTASIGSQGDIVILSTCNDASATAGSANFDSKIRVYSGACGALTCVGGNDDGVGCAANSSIYEFQTIVGTEYYVLVHGFSSFAGTFFLSMDCEIPASCISPYELDAHIYNGGNVKLEWSQIGQQDGWEIEFGPQGFVQGTGTMVTSTVPSFTLIGLPMGTVFEYYVRAQCLNDVGTSPWSEKKAFYILPDLCSGLPFADSGPDSLLYQNNEDFTYVLCPDNLGDTMALEFTFVDLESSISTTIPNGCFDFLSIYNGVGTSDTLATALCGRASGAQPWDPNSLLSIGDRFQSTDPSGCLTVKFHSDHSVILQGWSAQAECIPGPCLAPSNLDVIEIGFGTTDPKVNASWYNPEGTPNCEVRGGRISGATAGTANPQFSNLNNTQVLTQTNGSTVNFNIKLYNNPTIPFVQGQTYGYEVRCYCEHEAAYSPWSDIKPESTFIVPFAPPSQQANGQHKSLEQVLSLSMNIVPNPNDGSTFQVQLDQNMGSGLTFEIIDIKGRTVWTARISSEANQYMINPEVRLSQGIYLARLSSESGVAQERFIVE